MKLSTSIYLFAQFIYLLAVPSVIFSSGTLHELSGRREELTQQLDSLNLLKQDLKREGTAITEIELRQERLRDSLNYLRSRIQSMSERHSPAENRKSPSFIQLPTTLFDWIIVMVGGVAFFSGLMLVIGISRTLSSRKKRGGKKKEKSPSSQPVEKKPAENTPAPVYPSPMPSSAASDENETFSSLQQRIAHSPVPPTEYRPLPEKKRPQPVKKNTSVTAAPGDPSSLEEQVLAAANSGLDTAAISRKFHISVDHVALLLKMSVPRRK